MFFSEEKWHNSRGLPQQPHPRGQMGESSSKSFLAWTHLGIVKPFAAQNWKVLKAVSAYLVPNYTLPLQNWSFYFAFFVSHWAEHPFSWRRVVSLYMMLESKPRFLVLSSYGNVVWFDCTKLCSSYGLLCIMLFPLFSWGTVAVYA